MQALPTWAPAGLEVWFHVLVLLVASDRGPGEPRASRQMCPQPGLILRRQHPGLPSARQHQHQHQHLRAPGGSRRRPPLRPKTSQGQSPRWCRCCHKPARPWEGALGAAAEDLRTACQRLRVAAIKIRSWNTSTRDAPKVVVLITETKHGRRNAMAAAAPGDTVLGDWNNRSTVHTARGTAPPPSVWAAWAARLARSTAGQGAHPPGKRPPAPPLRHRPWGPNSRAVPGREARADQEAHAAGAGRRAVARLREGQRYRAGDGALVPELAGSGAAGSAGRARFAQAGRA
jgi:hypothetical protein